MIGRDDIGAMYINGSGGFFLKPVPQGLVLVVPHVRAEFVVPPSPSFVVPDSRVTLQVPHAHHNFVVPGEDP